MANDSIDARTLVQQAAVDQARAVAELHQSRLAALKVTPGFAGVLQQVPVEVGQTRRPRPKPGARGRPRTTQRKRKAELAREIERLIEMVAQRSGSAAIAEAIRARETECAAVDQDLKRLMTLPPPLRPEQIGDELRQLIPGYKEVLRGDTLAARELLGILFDERLEVTACGKGASGWEVTGAGDLSRLALRVLPRNLASPPGTARMRAVG